MTTGSIITAAMFALLAAAHSAAGESGFVKPLINAEWSITELPRPLANRLLRGAWHLTSVAWLAMATIAVGGTPLAAIAVAALVSGVVILVVGPGHPAWPLFMIAGGAGLYTENLLGDTLLRIGGGLTIAAVSAAAGLHMYWAAGGNALRDAVVPTTRDGGDQTFSPGPVATLAVAGLLIGFAGLLTITVGDLGPASWDPPIVRWLIIAGIVVLALRAVGDGRYAGFSKKHRSSRFGRMDDLYYTPLVVGIAMGAAGVLLI